MTKTSIEAYLHYGTGTGGPFYTVKCDKVEKDAKGYRVKREGVWRRVTVSKDNRATIRLFGATVEVQIYTQQ